MRTEIRDSLLEQITQLKVIDSHEHLPREQVRVETSVDLFTLFSQYTQLDLLNAGMSAQEYVSLFNQEVPLETRWKLFAPYWDRIRLTSYSKAVLLAVKKFYGFHEISESTYETISEAIRSANKPGIYDLVLRKTCGITKCINQTDWDRIGDWWDGEFTLTSDLFAPVLPVFYNRPYECIEDWENISQHPFLPVKTFDEHIDAQKQYVERAKRAGVVGLKMWGVAYGEPNRGEAAEFFGKIKSGTVDLRSGFPSGVIHADRRTSNPLRDYMIDWTLKLARDNDLPVCVHTGYWQDFRQINPLNMIPLLFRHPEVRFDIYHLGYPWIRETLMLAKGFPNVWLNFCWTHIISQQSARDALRESMDLLPTNKILGFGGDYNIPVEKVYGHLTMARENIAAVLAERVENKQINEDRAVEIARMWLWDNPLELYLSASRSRIPNAFL